MRKNAIADASDAQRAAALAREPVFRVLAARSLIGKREVDEAADALHLSRAMFYRLLARYKRDPRVSALVANSPGRKNGSQLLDPDIEIVIRDCIRKFYLTAEKPTLTTLYRTICDRCNIAGMGAPSYNTVRARVKTVDLKDLVRHRVGPKAEATARSVSDRSHLDGRDRC